MSGEHSNPAIYNSLVDIPVVYFRPLVFYFIKDLEYTEIPYCFSSPLKNTR